MNIADGGMVIVGQPRTGSTNLQKSICSYYKKKIIFEPNFMTDDNYDPLNDVVKVFPYHPAYHDGTEKFDYNVVLNKIKQFNTIILLNRRNKNEQIESFYAVIDKLEGVYEAKWYDSLLDISKERYEYYKGYFDEADSIHKRIASDLNLEINFFEDVFKDKKLNIDIGLDLEYFSKDRKLRINSKKQKTLI